MTTPRRGEVWLANLNPVTGHEQGGTRPCLIMSADDYNGLPISMTIVVPLTGRDRGLSHHIPIKDAGLDRPTVARPEDVRAISTQRLRRQLGTARDDEVAAVAAVLRNFLEL